MDKAEDGPAWTTERDIRGITGLAISPDGESFVRFWDLKRGEPTSPHARSIAP